MGPSGSGIYAHEHFGLFGQSNFWILHLEWSRRKQVARRPIGSIRNREIGFVFQTFNLLPRYTALENVALPMVYAGFSKAERMGRAREVLAQVGLGDRMDHRPNELSGGQRQRVAVGRALVMPNHPCG